MIFIIIDYVATPLVPGIAHTHVDNIGLRHFIARPRQKIALRLPDLKSHFIYDLIYGQSQNTPKIAVKMQRKVQVRLFVGTYGNLKT